MGLSNLVTGVTGAVTNTVTNTVSGTVSQVGSLAQSLTQPLTGAASAILPAPAREIASWGQSGMQKIGLEALRLPGLPSLPSLPGLPGLPALGKLPGLPSLPQLPGLPAIPGLPGGSLPGLPGLPSLPGLKLPGMPDMPRLPGLPGLPGGPGGSLPGIPGIPGLPMLPGLPSLPKLPGLPSLPGFPGLPPLPGLPKDPGGMLPHLPAMPFFPALPQLPALPKLPGVPNFGLPHLPSLPDLPSLPRPGLPALPDLPGLPSLPNLPDLPNIPGLPFFNNDNRPLPQFKGPDSVTLANMAQDVYHNTASPPAGWRTASPEELASIGLRPSDLAPAGSPFFARVYTTGEGADKQYVVSFRGSTSDRRDWETNGKQAMGMSTPHYTAALSIGRKLAQAGVTNVTMTGHSLGGGLASAAALASGRNAQTFNAAGLSDVTINQANTIRTAAGAGEPGDIRAYYVRGEILSLLQDGGDRVIGSLLGGVIAGPFGGIAGAGIDAPEAYGTRIELDAVRPQGTPWWQGHPVSRHGMDWVIEGLKNQ